jgi:hypothetical protein
MIQTERTPHYLPRRTARLVILSALWTGLLLGGSLSFPFWYGLIYYYTPASVQAQLAIYLSPDSLPDIWHSGTIVGAVIWGLTLARISGIRPLWRLGLAGGVGVFLGQVLWTFPAIDLQDALWPDVPPHIRLAREFVVGIGVAAGITALSFGLAIRWERAALWLGISRRAGGSLPCSHCGSRPGSDWHSLGSWKRQHDQSGGAGLSSRHRQRWCRNWVIFGSS